MISVQYPSFAQNKNVTAAVNGGLEGNVGIVSATQGTNISLDVFIVPGVSGVSISAGADAGEAASSVHGWVC